MTEYGEIARCTICGGEPTIRIRHSGAYIKCKTCGNGFEVVRNDFENPRNKEQELYGVWNAKQDANRRFLEMNAESVAPIDTSIHDHLEKSNKEIVASILKATEELADAFTEKYNALAEQLSSLSRQIAEKPIGKMSDILKSGIEVSFAQFGTTLDDKLKAMENNIIDAVDCGTDSVCNAIEGRPAECESEPVSPKSEIEDDDLWIEESEPEPTVEEEPEPEQTEVEVEESEESTERGTISNPSPSEIKAVADALKTRAAEEGISMEELESALKVHLGSMTDVPPTEPTTIDEPTAIVEPTTIDEPIVEHTTEVKADEVDVEDTSTETMTVEPEPNNEVATVEVAEPVAEQTDAPTAEPVVEQTVEAEPTVEPTKEESAEDKKRKLLDATDGMSYDELTAYLQDFLASRKG